MAKSIEGRRVVCRAQHVTTKRLRCLHADKIGPFDFADDVARAIGTAQRIRDGQTRRRACCTGLDGSDQRAHHGRRKARPRSVVDEHDIEGPKRGQTRPDGRCTGRATLNQRHLRRARQRCVCEIGLIRTDCDDNFLRTGFKQLVDRPTQHRATQQSSVLFRNISTSAYAAAGSHDQRAKRHGEGNSSRRCCIAA
jgi:hypothetical protein